MIVTAGREVTIAKAGPDWTYDDLPRVDVSRLTDGGWVVAWSSAEASRWDIFARLYEADGNARGNQVKVSDVSDWRDVSVFSSDDGGFLVSWRFWHARAFTESGVPLNHSVTFGNFTGVGLSDGRWLDTYPDREHRLDVFQRIYDPATGKATTPHRVNTYTPDHQSNAHSFALTDGGWITLWESSGQEAPTQSKADVLKYGTGLYFQRFKANGTAVGSETHANTTTEGYQTDETLAQLKTGGWVVAWRSESQDNNVFLQVFDKGGHQIGDETRIDATTVGQSMPNITPLAKGRFVVTWSQDDEADASDVHQRLFDKKGNPIGEATTVNTFTDGYQWSPQTIALKSGGWVVIWESRDAGYGKFYNHPEIQSQDGSGAGIYQQVFNADGTRKGGEIRVNLSANGSQDSFQAAALGGNKWVVTWITQQPADDKLALVQQRVFSVDVAEATPKAIHLDTKRVAEGGVMGDEIGTFTASRVHGAAFNWWLTDDADGLFEVDPYTGELRVARTLGLDYEQATSHQITVVVSDGTVTIEKLLTIKVLDVSRENMTGTYLNDHIVGGALNDKFDGTRGDDTVEGRGGLDTLTGGSGADIFAFTSELGPENVDTIRDFKHSVDKIVLAGSVFISIDDTLEATEFIEATTAGDVDDFIVYDRTSGKLFYDHDGAGGDHKVMFAILENKPTLDVDDFVIV